MRLKISLFIRILSICLLCTTLGLSIALSAQSPYQLETIEILPKPQAFHRQSSQDCDKGDGSAHNLCYGRGMVFDVVRSYADGVPATPACAEDDVPAGSAFAAGSAPIAPASAEEHWRIITSQRMKDFYDKMKQAKICSNSLVVSLSFKWGSINDPARLTLPYIFFSGYKSRVTSRVYLTKKDASEAADSMPVHVREQVVDAMQQNSIESIVGDLFQDTFTVPKFNGLYFVFRDKKKEESELPEALAFRNFIYGHFIEQAKYEVFFSKQPIWPIR